MPTYGFRTANKRYKRLFWPAMGTYVVAVIGGSWIIRMQDEPATWMLVAAALAAALPVIFVLGLMLRQIGETDEYTRLRKLQAFAQGAVITVSAIFLAGFLQLFEVIGPIEVFWFGPLFFFAYGVSSCRNIFTGKTV